MGSGGLIHRRQICKKLAPAFTPNFTCACETMHVVKIVAMSKSFFMMFFLVLIECNG
jgi:hypothetical protein